MLSDWKWALTQRCTQAGHATVWSNHGYRQVATLCDFCRTTIHEASALESTVRTDQIKKDAGIAESRAEYDKDMNPTGQRIPLARYATIASHGRAAAAKDIRAQLEGGN